MKLSVFQGGSDIALKRERVGAGENGFVPLRFERSRVHIGIAEHFEKKSVFGEGVVPDGIYFPEMSGERGELFGKGFADFRLEPERNEVSGEEACFVSVFLDEHEERVVKNALGFFR